MNVENHEVKIRQTLFLVIYAPRRGILEVSNPIFPHEASFEVKGLFKYYFLFLYEFSIELQIAMTSF